MSGVPGPRRPRAGDDYFSEPFLLFAPCSDAHNKAFGSGLNPGRLAMVVVQGHVQGIQNVVLEENLGENHAA